MKDTVHEITASRAAYTNDIPHTPLRFALYAIKPHKWWFVATTTVVIVAAAISQSTSYFFKLIVDAAESGASDKVLLYAILFPCTVFVVQLLFRLSGYLGMRAITTLNKTTTDLLSQYVLDHSHSYFPPNYPACLHRGKLC